MTERYFRKRLATAVLALVLCGLVVGVGLWFKHRSSPIPLDSVAWIAANPKADDTRYRMVKDAVRTINSQKWTLDQVLMKLGSPDSPNPFVRSPNAPISLIYEVGYPRYSLSVPEAYYLRLIFAADGRLISCGVYPK